MSLRLVIVEGGVGHRTAAAQDGAARQRERRIRVPRLGDGGRGTEEHAEGEDGGERDAHPSQISRRAGRSEEHTSELQSLAYLVCRLLLEKKKKHRGNSEA